MTDDLSHLCNFAGSVHFESMARSLLLIIGFNLMIWRLNTVSASYRTKDNISRNVNLIRFQGFRNKGSAIPSNIPMYNSAVYPGMLLEAPNPKCSVFLKIFWLPIFEQNFDNSFSTKQIGYRRGLTDHEKVIESEDQVSKAGGRRTGYITNDTTKLNDEDNDKNRSNDVDDLQVEKEKNEYNSRRIFSDKHRPNDDNNDDDLTFKPNRKYMDLVSDDDNDVNNNYRRYYSHTNGPYLSSYHSDDIKPITFGSH